MASVPHPLPDELVELIAAALPRALGEPMRIKLLDRLREGAATVARAAEATGASQQNVSKHLGVLLQAGLVGRDASEGNFVRYSIADDSVFELCEQVCGGLRRQLDELDALLDGSVTRLTDAHAADRAHVRARRAGRSSACCSRWPAR